MQSISLSVNNVSSRPNSGATTVSVVSCKNTNNTMNSNPNSEFYWDDIMDESFIRGVIDSNGNLIK